MEKELSPAFGDASLVEARRLMRALENEPAHVEQVARLALQLFDALAPLHGGGAEDRLVLEIAALLHDIGWSESEDGSRHHKISARLMLEYPWMSLPPDDLLLAACVARYHRKAPPRPSHRLFGTLSPEDQVRVTRLSGLLRVADGLDRTHLQRVQRVAVSQKTGVIRILVEGSGNLRAEIAGALRKADVFEDAFGGRLEIDQA